ncbi:hypothetical protein F4553_003958 [Allocatelliglobosispora scoriae]|uniref:Uncharacterized protein n=1 Tax=Allocatelliglobosispora scoriae TaxID=643052 RepID=A0A841BTU4_9ACTN|nr:hypothetical protein [Allocatelliglobosispora scoriae]MBB5870579.1 hypothetical protein [Allocatelliglobosispora scoriae]
MYFDTLFINDHECTDQCADGLRPAGTRGILGPVNRACLTCGERCDFCDTTAVFPVPVPGNPYGYCEACLALKARAVGMILTRCHECYGITGLMPLDPADRLGLVHHTLGCDHADEAAQL